jgi:phenylacetate-CoA ligase
VFREADAVIVLSPEWGERIRDITGVTDAVVLPNPVVIPSMPSAGSRGVVFLGRLGANKGTHELVEAVGRLQRSGLITPVVIAGDGDVGPTRSAVAKLEHPEVVSVPGWIDQEHVSDLLGRYGVFCLPSFEEGKPVSLLQAMSYGLACVTTPVGGIPDVIKDGETGLLIEPGDVTGLAGALERVLSDETLRARLGAAARERVSREHDIVAVVGRLEDIYDDILAPESGASTEGVIHTLRALYEALPLPVKLTAGTLARMLPVRLRYGSVFIDTTDQIRAAEFATAEEHLVLQERLLAALVAAARTAPYWREVFSTSGLSEGPRSIRDLERLPLLDKETVRANVARMVTSASSQDARKWVTTGGTSGRPLGLWIDKDASLRDWAFVVNAWQRVGFRLDERRVVLRGRRLGSGERRVLTELEPIRREMYVSTFDLDREHLPEIRQRVRRFGARYIHGYPSAMEVLGKSYLDAGESTPETNVLLAVSENLYPGQREALERLFGARVFSFYGMTEKGGFAAECEVSTELHVEPCYGYLELVDAAGCCIRDPGIRGEIVVTGFLSKAVPLIRYRTGDFAVWAEGPCACGRAHPRLVSIEGRWTQEYLIGRNGARISMTAINVHSSAFDQVQRFTFLQTEPGSVTLQIEPAPAFDDVAGRFLLTELEAKLAGQVEVHLETVDRLPHTPAGKHRFIDQQIPKIGESDATGQ